MCFVGDGVGRRCCRCALWVVGWGEDGVGVCGG